MVPTSCGLVEEPVRFFAGWESREASGPQDLANIIEVWGGHSPRDAVWSLIVPVGSSPARGRIADVVCAKRRCGSPLGRPQSSYNQ